MGYKANPFYFDPSLCATPSPLRLPPPLPPPASPSPLPTSPPRLHPSCSPQARPRQAHGDAVQHGLRCRPCLPAFLPACLPLTLSPSPPTSLPPPLPSPPPLPAPLRSHSPVSLAAGFPRRLTRPAELRRGRQAAHQAILHQLGQGRAPRPFQRRFLGVSTTRPCHVPSGDAKTFQWCDDGAPLTCTTPRPLQDTSTTRP